MGHFTSSSTFTNIFIQTGSYSIGAAYFTGSEWTAPQTSTQSGSAYIDDGTTAESTTWDPVGHNWIATAHHTWSDWADTFSSSCAYGSTGKGIFTFTLDACDADPGHIAASGTCSSTVHETIRVLTDTGVSGNYDDKTTISDEFTDPMLRGKIVGLLPDFPAETPPSMWQTGPGTALYTLDGLGKYGVGAKMRYRLKVQDSEKDIAYYMTWDEVTTTLTSTNSVPQHETIMGTGDPINPAYGGVHTVDMPQTPNIWITETTPTLVSGGGTGSGSSLAGNGSPGAR